MITRRRAIKTLGIGSLGAYLAKGTFTFAAERAILNGGNPLSIPELAQGELSEGTRKFQLNLQQGSREFFPNISTPTFGINGNYLGPTLRFQRNELVSLQVNNQLGEPSTLHWHGFHVPAQEDGGPHQVIANGDSWTAQFSVRQFASTFWYHSHMLHSSGEQVYKGLAGMIIVEEDDLQLELPSTYGVDDIPLIVQDRRFSNDGSFQYLSAYQDSVIGMHGDTILVNGTAQAYLEVSTTLVRFRLLNASNARTYTFAFSDGRDFKQIASDGGFLEKPVTLNKLELAPAERGEIVVDFSDGQQLQLVSLGRVTNFPEFPGAMSEMMRSLNAQEFDILDIRPQEKLQNSAELPEHLTSIYRLPEAAASNTRQFKLSMGSGMRSGDDRGPGTGSRNGNGGGYGGGNFSINGRRMDTNFINERIQFNTTEIWELSNNSPMMHPFHVHNGQFQLLDRDGQPPSENELGWKDTVRVGSGEKVRIIMRFTDFTDNESAYMYHCHILEHEDNGMMGQFLVIRE
ncbi:MAG: oxidase [SAR86 cluster bacterium]|uniref:Oxidase n=1 Tax=SAR86 cluster bacterium TaxID=2030880 RepID=A0A2A5ATK7_9GAMM|nr:MAG: oxidase [SAR86 cluster bacterium]